MSTFGHLNKLSSTPAPNDLKQVSVTLTIRFQIRVLSFLAKNGDGGHHGHIGNLDLWLSY